MAPITGRAALAALALLVPVASAACSGPCEALFAGPSVCASALAPAAGASRAQDLCYLQCTVCCASPFVAWQLGAGTACAADAVSPASVVAAATDAFMNTSALHGQFFMDDAGDIEENATQSVSYLLAGMPRRDLLLLSANPTLVIDFVLEHVRFALHTRAWSSALNVTWQLFADAVLPYAILDEKRDMYFRWRPRFARLFRDATSGAATTSEAMRRLAVLVPQAASLGALALSPGGGDLEVVPGPPIAWRSSSSPAFISVEQVAQFGGSCTGTAIVLVAAARAVGIPARLAGCGESGQSNDDHHWIEYWDASSPGPFGDFWHTKEGESAGNTGGPWDSASGPMLGCLAGVVPFSGLDSLWAASWASPVYMPMLWANDTWAQTWSFVGGLDRCGAYCTAWGCGVNNSQHWLQAQCSQYSA